MTRKDIDANERISDLLERVVKLTDQFDIAAVMTGQDHRPEWSAAKQAAGRIAYYCNGLVTHFPGTKREGEPAYGHVLNLPVYEREQPLRDLIRERREQFRGAFDGGNYVAAAEFAGDMAGLAGLLSEIAGKLEPGPAGPVPSEEEANQQARGEHFAERGHIPGYQIGSSGSTDGQEH